MIAILQSFLIDGHVQACKQTQCNIHDDWESLWSTEQPVSLRDLGWHWKNMDDIYHVR